MTADEIRKAEKKIVNWQTGKEKYETPRKDVLGRPARSGILRRVK